MSAPEDYNSSGESHQPNNDNGDSHIHQLASDSFDTNKNGFHQHYFPSGDFYKGEWKDNKMHGEGILILNVDKGVVTSTILVSFQGEFQNGLPTNGRAEYADGSIFDGDLVDGLQHGMGVYTKGGLSVTGQFSNGSPTGQVNVIFQDGDDMTSYTGELNHNCLHGPNALIRFPSVSLISSYHGQFNFNARVGWGVLTFRLPQSTILSIDTTENQLDVSTTITTTLSSSRYNKNGRTVAVPTKETSIYRFDGFSHLPGSNLHLSPHYHVHASQTTTNSSTISASTTIRKIYGLFELDRLCFGTVYYVDGSVYTGFLLPSTEIAPSNPTSSYSNSHSSQSSSATHLDTTYPPSTHRPADINPFFSHEDAILRHGFGVMYHYCGNNTGTITMGEWNYDHPHGQTITLYNFDTPASRSGEQWQTEIEKQQDYEELEPKDESNRSQHFIFSRSLIMQGEVQVLKYLRELIEHASQPQPQPQTGQQSQSRMFSFHALYVGHLQRGVRQDQGLYLTLTRYQQKHLHNSALNFPPLLPNNEIDAYYGTWEDDLPHNSGQYVFLPSNQHGLQKSNIGLTTQSIAWEYLLHYKFHYQFDVVEFQKYKHQLYKDASQIKQTETGGYFLNNSCSLSYYSGSSFYSSRTFGLSLYTTATTDSTEPDVLFYGLHHAPNSDIYNRAKTRSYCQDMVTFLHSDLYRNNTSYKQYYIDKSMQDNRNSSNTSTTTVISQQFLSQPTYIPVLIDNDDQNVEKYEQEQEQAQAQHETTETNQHDTNNTSSEPSPLPSPTSVTRTMSNTTTTVNVTILPDKYMQPSSFNAMTANNCRGDSNFSSSLSLPNIGALFYFTPNQSTETDQVAVEMAETEQNVQTIDILTKVGPYKRLSIWFGAVTLSLQRLGHGCLCLDINMDEFVKNNSLTYQKRKTNLYGSTKGGNTNSQHGAFSALRTNTATQQANNQDAWVVNSNYIDPLSHPLLMYFLSDHQGHFTSMTQLQANSTLFTASSTSNNAMAAPKGKGASNFSSHHNAHSPQNSHSNSQYQQHQLVKLFSSETITSVSSLKIFSFFLYDMCFFGTIIGKSSIWQGPIATLLLPTSSQLSSLLECSNSTPTSPSTSSKLLLAFKQLLTYIASRATHHIQTSKSKSYTDLLGDQQHNKMIDEKFAKQVQRFQSTPFLTTDVNIINQFLDIQHKSLINKDDEDSIQFETIRAALLGAIFSMHIDTTRSSHQSQHISPCCPQLGQFYAYGLGEMHYLMKKHLDGTSFSNANEKYTGFVMLAPISFEKDGPIDKYGCTLQNESNHPVVNKYVSKAHSVFSKLNTHQDLLLAGESSSKLDPFQLDALSTLRDYDKVIQNITNNMTFITQQQKFPKFDPTSPTLLEQSNDTNTVFALLNVLLDGAITTANSPNVFLGNLVDTTPYISIISPKLVHHITPFFRLLPLSHGTGTITAGNFSQCQTVGHFDLGVILEGVEVDDTGDFYIGPYITVINQHTGEKQQQRHGKYIVILTLRKWVTICQYDHGDVTTGKVYYNVQQHVLNELTELKPAQVEDFNFDEYALRLYNNRAALQKKLLSNSGRANLNTSSSELDSSSSSLLLSSSSTPTLKGSSSSDDIGEDIFALPYDPNIMDITQLHGYSTYFVTTNDDIDKANEPLYEDELVEILHTITIPPTLEDNADNDPANQPTTDTADDMKTDAQKLIVRVTNEGLVCFDRTEDEQKAEADATNRSLVNQVRTQRCFRYRLPAPDSIGQLSRLYYEGGLDSGFLPHGNGELTWSTPHTRSQFTPQQHFSISLSPETAPCEKYTGSFEHGVLHGQGKASYHTPDDYSLVDYNTSTHVSSSFLCPCVKEFHGEFNVGSPILGKVYFDPNSFEAGQTYKIYTGTINSAGEFEGEGLLTYADGHKFKGSFKQNLPIQGSLAFTNGVKYNGLMHSVAVQDIMLDPFYLDVVHKISSLQNKGGLNQSRPHMHGAQPFVPPNLRKDTTSTSTYGKNQPMVNEQLAYGNVFTFSHFTIFQQMCKFLSSHYHSCASNHQYLELDEDNADLQHHSSQYYDVPLPLTLSSFSPLFLDMKQQRQDFLAYQQLQQQQKSQQQLEDTVSSHHDHDHTDASIGQIERPPSSRPSSSSTIQDEEVHETSIFDMRERLQQLMLKLKAYNQLKIEDDAANPKSTLVIPFTNSHLTPTSLDMQEKALESEIINFMYDLKLLTSELYPTPQQRSTTQTSLIPFDQQPPYEAMYILFQGKLTVISLKQIVRLFGVGTITFPDATIYDDVNPSTQSFLYRCKEIIAKTVKVCLENTDQTIQELTCSSDDDMKAWPLFSLPSSSAIKTQLDLQQQQISRHTQSLTLGIHENLDLSSFGTRLQNLQFSVSSTNYKSRLSENLVTAVKELQQIVTSEQSQRGDSENSVIDSLNEFLDEEAAENDDDFDPTKEKPIKSPKTPKLAKRIPPSPAHSTTSSPRQLGAVPTLSVPKQENKNETILGGVLKFILPQSVHKKFMNQEDDEMLSPEAMRLQNQDIEYLPQCDSRDYVEFKLQQLHEQKAQITAKLGKLKSMLKQEEADYASCCARFGTEQFSQTDAIAITAPIWSTHQATGLLFDKQCDFLNVIRAKHTDLVDNPIFSHTIYDIIDNNVDVLELALLRKEIVQEDRLKILFLLTKITMAFKHRRLLLVLLLHSLSRRDSIISILNHGLVTHNDGILKKYLAPTRAIFQHINEINTLLISLKDKLKTNLNTLMNDTIPLVQKKNRTFIEKVLTISTTEFTALRSRVNSTWSEFDSALTTLTQTIVSTTILLEKRRKQRSQLSQVLFVEELQHHIFKNDLLSTYALIYATNFAPEAVAMLRTRQSKDHPLDLTTFGQRTWLTAIQLSCSLGLPHMTVLLHRVGCSLAQKTATSIHLKKGDQSTATSVELTIPEHLSNKHIVELIVDSNHIDMLGVLHFLGFSFETTNITTTTVSYDKDQNKRITNNIRPLLHHYVKKNDAVVVKYLLLLGLDPNVTDNSNDNITTIMLACQTFSDICIQNASINQGRSPKSTQPQVRDKFSQSAYEDTTSFGVSTAAPEEALSTQIQARLDSSVEIVQFLVQYGAKLTCKDQSQNTCLHHLFSAFYDQQPQTGSQQLFPHQLKQLASWLVSHGARYRELRNDKNQPAYYHPSLCTDFDQLRNAYVAQSQQFSYNFIALTSKDQRWQADNDCHTCTDCEVEFGVFTRKHHCRCCGYIYCEPCSKITINNNTIRCCGSCYNKMHMVTTPRDRRRDIQQAQQRGNNKQILPGDLIAPSNPNYATFLPQFIQDFHEEVYTKSSNRFAPRGTCSFLQTVVKQTVGDFQPQPNFAFKSITSIVNKSTQLSKDLQQLDQIRQQTVAPQQQQQQQQTAPPKNLMGNSRVQPTQKIGVPPPKSGIPLPPGKSQLPNQSIPKPQVPVPRTSVSELPTEPLSTPPLSTPPASVEQKLPKTEDKLTRGPIHIGQISEWASPEEENEICRKVKALLEQTGSVGNVANQNRDNKAQTDNDKYVLIHVSPGGEEEAKMMQKARNPLEDDVDDPIDGKNVLNLATAIQKSPLDDSSHHDDDFDLFG